jgi:hypothetical protein
MASDGISVAQPAEQAGFPSSLIGISTHASRITCGWLPSRTATDELF